MTTQEILADRPSRVEVMTGLTSKQVDRLVLDVYAAGGQDPAYRRVVGPYRAVLIVLLYLRHCDDERVAWSLGLTRCATGFVP